MADSGVWLAGLSTTGQPAAMAGASLWATRLSGKLNGLMAPTTPIGHAEGEPELALADVGRVERAPSRRPGVRASAAANVERAHRARRPRPGRS